MDINQFPKSKKLLEDFASKELMAIQQLMLKDIPEGIESGLPDILPEYVQQAVSHFVDTGSRTLYDFFDINSVVITIHKADEWFYTINSGEFSESNYKSRKECELAAFEEAFKQLEEKI